MKTLIFSLITICSFSTFAGVATIANQLGKIAESGVTVYNLEGKTNLELVESLQYQAEGENEIILDYKNVETMDEMVWGTTDAQTFDSILFAAVHFMDDDANANQVVYSQSELNALRTLLSNLKKTDVIYSWNPNGDSVCGQMLTTPVLIDAKTKTAYEFNFYKIEGC